MHESVQEKYLGDLINKTGKHGSTISLKGEFFRYEKVLAIVKTLLPSDPQLKVYKRRVFEVPLGITIQ